MLHSHARQQMGDISAFDLLLLRFNGEAGGAQFSQETNNVRRSIRASYSPVLQHLEKALHHIVESLILLGTISKHRLPQQRYRQTVTIAAQHEPIVAVYEHGGCLIPAGCVISSNTTGNSDVGR